MFRELLQNSDDASSSAVEIHFETEAYVHRRQTASLSSSSDTPDDDDEAEKLPDLKTAIVRHQMPRVIAIWYVERPDLLG